MNKTLIGILIGIAIAAGAYFIFFGSRASAGPNGGDLVSLGDGDTYAELLANPDSGELMVHTWDSDLETRRPINNEPLVVGSGNYRAQLHPHSMPSDPPRRCSRFYGQAEWARGGRIGHGWMHQVGREAEHREFTWDRCWRAGRSHGAMWDEMSRHGPMGHRPSHRGDGGRE